MRIVIGLGNPGDRYRLTRHNVGFRVVDLLAERAGGATVRRSVLRSLRAAWGRKARPGGPSWTAEVLFGDHPLVLAKPKTYMNRSGVAARALCRHHGVSPQDLLLVHDDADLELGRVRLRTTGQAGGHNGVQSVIDALGTKDFPRLKLGVRGAGRGERELADYVLDEFEPAERAVAAALVELAADAVHSILEHDLPTAMTLFSGRSAAPRQDS